MAAVSLDSRKCAAFGRMQPWWIFTLKHIPSWSGPYFLISLGFVMFVLFCNAHICSLYLDHVC